jgi:FkbM family methyltransferase
MTIFPFFEKILRSYLKKVDKKFNTILLNAIKNLPVNTSLTLIDIGAAGDIEPRWKKFESILEYIGFEPDERSRDLLLQKKNKCLNYKLFPYALWNTKGEIKIHLCKAPQVSSHFHPNKNFVNLFPNSKRFNIEKEVLLPSEKLDDINISSADFIKIDIQGGELNALKGGIGLLDKTLGLELEVEFQEIYTNQPLFGEVSTFITNKGFEFIDFVSIFRWQRKAHNGFGQCIFADALFLRTPECIMKLSSTDYITMSKYLSICLLYNRFDLIDRLLELMNDTQKVDFVDFLKAIQPLRKKDLKLTRISNLANKAIRLYGNEYRVHLTY